MKDYEVLGHIADTMIKVKGDTLEELFTAAVEGMAHITKHEFEERNDITIEVETEAKTQTDLLIDFLSEVLTNTHVEKAIFNKIKFKKLTENTLKAEITGTKLPRFDEDIKAVTYHEAETKQNEKGQFETNIVFDI